MSLESWSEHPEARAELLAAADRLPVELAEVLIDHTEKALEDVLAYPDAWPKVHYWDEQPTLRHRHIKPFRLHAIYYVADDEVRVIAYAHERRRPGYWQDRVED